MSLEGIRQIIQDAWWRDDFRAALRTHPDLAMVNYDVTMTEIVALKAHDAEILEAMGLEPALARQWQALWENP